MNPKVKKALIFTGLGLDVAITVFLFVVSLIMLITQPKEIPDPDAFYQANPGMITYFQTHPTAFLLICVVPLAILLVGNIVLLVLYMRKAANQKTELSDLSEEQKAALRAEILKDMDESKEEKK